MPAEKSLEGENISRRASVRRSVAIIRGVARTAMQRLVVVGVSGLPKGRTVKVLVKVFQGHRESEEGRYGGVAAAA